MPALWMRSFKPALGTVVGKPIRVFNWQDDPVEDADFAAAMTAQFVTNVTVDRSGPTPVLRWEGSGGTPKSKELGAVGTHYFSYPSGGPDALDVTGYWESDEYGRPFDLNDLLA